MDIPDSTDWLSTPLHLFEPLEAALRCQVCKEFYDTPMITTCAHTFCSLCIRRCITADGKCPACRSNAQADKLIRNWVVEDIVERYKAARPEALALARKETPEEKPTPSRKNKRKLGDTDIEDEGEPVGRSTRARTKRQHQGQEEAVRVEPEVITLDNSGDEDYVPEEEGMVHCPMCNKKMKEDAVFFHLDKCEGADSGRSSRSRSAKSNPNPFQTRQRQKTDSPAPTRLPQLNYSLLNDKSLGKKLKDLGIPNWGTKQLLTRRHTEWVNLWNSNCDSTTPKSKGQLLRELDVWERSQGGQAAHTESKIMKKDFNGDQWANNNKDQFSELIANARKKRGTPRPVENGDKHDTPQDSQGTPKQESTAEHGNGAPQMDGNKEESNPPSSSNPSKPYENNESALASIREKVDQANASGYAIRSLSRDLSNNQAITNATASSQKSNQDGSNFTVPSIIQPLQTRASLSQQPTSQISSPSPWSSESPRRTFESPVKKVPMFLMPQEPVSDVDPSQDRQ